MRNNNLYNIIYYTYNRKRESLAIYSNNNNKMKNLITLTKE